jgi:hypothetical protein
VSSLWTPSGGNPEPGSGSGPDAGFDEFDEAVDAPGLGDPDAEPDEEVVAEELRRVRAELAGTAVADLVANHAIGLWQLAVLHLTPEAGMPIRLDEAGLAIDAMAALVDGLGDRLGENADPLRDALSQLRLAFVQVSGGAEA